MRKLSFRVSVCCVQSSETRLCLFQGLSDQANERAWPRYLLRKFGADNLRRRRSVADLEVVLLRRRLVDHDLVRAGPVAFHELERVEGRVTLGDAEADRRRVADDRLALLVDQDRRLAGDAPLGALHLGNRADPREQGLVEGRRVAAAAVGEVERRPAGDHGVRALTGLVEDRVERLVDRVREDVGAAHHRDPEHDRDRGQDRTQLAAEQALHGELDHAVVIASSAARISGCVERGSSLTILPSARKSTRSAMAAARGSCVTITVVWPYSSTECLSRSRISLPVFESRLPVVLRPDECLVQG